MPLTKPGFRTGAPFNAANMGWIEDNIEDVEGRVATIEAAGPGGGDGASQAQVDDHETRLDAAEAAITALDGRVDALEARRPITALTFQSGSDVWTNMPSAVTEFLATAQRRIIMPLDGFTQARLLTSGTAGHTTANIFMAAWSASASYSGIDAATPTQVATLINVAGARISQWEDIRPELLNGEDVTLQVNGEAGNGTVDPIFTNIILFLR